jgi:hypothetical protein
MAKDSNVVDAGDGGCDRLVEMQALAWCDTLPLLLSRQQDLRVHSVFRHACNLQTPDRTLLTLQSRDTPLVPRGCILPCDDLLPWLSQDARVQVRHGEMIAPGMHVALHGAHGVDTRLAIHHDGRDLSRLRQDLLQFLAEEPPANGIHDMQRGRGGPWSPQIQSGLGDALVMLRERVRSAPPEVAEIASCLRELVGLGIGLTPSADDFLLGILLVMDYLRAPVREAFVAALHPLQSRTTDVSAAMLDNACAGRYGVLLPKLFTTQDPAVTLRQIAAHGHSSGHDMLCGASFALECLDPVQRRQIHERT